MVQTFQRYAGTIELMSLHAAQILACWAIVSTFILSAELVLGTATVWMLLATGAAIVFLVAVYVLRRPAMRAIEWISLILKKGTAARYVLAVLAVGTLLRLSWAWGFLGPLKSDGATYYSLAVQLANTAAYGHESTGYAYWPPGLPLYLVPFVTTFGNVSATVLAANILLYFVTFWALFKLGRMSGSDTAARAAVLILSIWPNLIFSVTLASKELLALCLINLSVLAFMHGERSRTRFVFAAGLFLGLATLTQPSFLLFPLVFFFAAALYGKRMPILVRNVSLLVIGMAVVVSPWTYRNLQVLGGVVLVSTNGGDVFYRANNSLATGGYTPSGEVDLSDLPELEKNRRGYALGREWIRENPWLFAKLLVRRQILFLGDDASGVYETIKRSLELQGPLYIVLKVLSNGFWVLLWLLVLFGWRGSWYLPNRNIQLPVLLSVLYPLAIDSVYESGGRHHLPVAGFIAFMAAIAFAGRVSTEAVPLMGRRSQALRSVVGR
jgi:4-amino-4-deoxy-L-arabinose transferase-like glycosyltransferase